MPPKACSICEKTRGASDHKAFDIRACAECIEALTLSDYRLKKEWGLTSEILKNSNLRHSTKNLWSRHGGSYSLDFYLKDEVLPMLVTYHGAKENTWDAISLAMNEARDLKDLESARLLKIAVAEKDEKCKALKSAIKASGILLKDVKLCPALKNALAKSTTDFDVEQVASNVQFFVVDQAAKTTWMDTWYAQNCLANESWWTNAEIETSNVVASNALIEIDRIKCNVNVTTDAAQTYISDWSAKIKAEYDRKMTLKTWLIQRCILPVHDKAKESGLDAILKNMGNQGFYDAVNKHLVSFTIVCADLENTGYYSMENVDTGKIHEFEHGICKKLVKYEYTTFTTSSLANNTSYNPKFSFHVILNSWWDTVFPVYLPPAVKMECFAKMKEGEIVSTKPQSNHSKPQHHHHEKTYWCTGCFENLERHDALVSPYHRGIWCETCIEADFDMAGSKWENL